MIRIHFWSTLTNRYETVVEGEGTTFGRLHTSDRWGFDDYESSVHAVWKDSAGRWRQGFVCWTKDLGEGPTGCAVVEDATPEARAEYAAWRAAEDAREAAERAARRAAADARAAHASARVVQRDRFVVVRRGRKTPVGTVGRVFWLGNPRQYAWRVTVQAGLQTTEHTEPGPKGYARAKDAVFVDAANLDVLLPSMPEDHAEVVALYRCAAFVVELADLVLATDTTAEGETPRDLQDVFTALWTRLYASPCGLAVALACGPSVGGLPKLSDTATYTVDEVLEAVESDAAARVELERAVEEIVRGTARSADALRASAVALRATVCGTLGVSYAPPVTAKKPRAKKAAA